MTSSTNREPIHHYFERVGRSLPIVAEAEPVCLYLETTNRCNILCTTCPRTFEELEPPADMSWELFTSIVDQFPKIERVVLHGVGEPLMTRDLMRMIRYLKARGTYVLFNTNATLLTRKKGEELIEAGLDEMRVSLDAAEPIAYEQVRGLPLFNRVVENVRAFIQLQHEFGAVTPRVSLWLTGLKETIDQLAAFVRLAHALGVEEVYLQRLVYFNEGQGLARAESALFEALDSEGSRLIDEAEQLAESLGIRFNASGATEPGISLRKKETNNPWSLCRRPWTLMYFTAHGRALPCCIAPFSMMGYNNFTLGDARQQTLREIWNGEQYREFRRALLTDTPPKACENCGLRWSL
jgi:MoaA/NifB/PqqE/SkfB family radical SAM enzyme